MEEFLEGKLEIVKDGRKEVFGIDTNYKRVFGITSDKRKNHHHFTTMFHEPYFEREDKLILTIPQGVKSVWLSNTAINILNLELPDSVEYLRCSKKLKGIDKYSSRINMKLV